MANTSKPNETKSAETKPADLRKVEVKVLRAHGNQHGAKYAKEKDSTYIHPRPAADIKAGLVELAVKDAPKAK